MRNRAASALGTLGDPRAVDPLAAQLDSDDNLHQMLVLNSLAKLGDHRITPRVYQIAVNESEFGLVRVRAIIRSRRPRGSPSGCPRRRCLHRTAITLFPPASSLLGSVNPRLGGRETRRVEWVRGHPAAQGCIRPRRAQSP